LDLERDCPTAAHWTEQQYRQAFQRQDSALRFCLVAEREAVLGVTGFLVARRIDSEWELENIVVAAQSRRNGLGKRLLQSLLNEVRDTDGESVFLEVRESNTAARKLYEKMGFHETGRRKSYYSSPQEDAVLYCCNVHT
jgi:[ribosomal protein S18]-alanine N-acetyltransferase